MELTIGREDDIWEKVTSVEMNRSNTFYNLSHQSLILRIFNILLPTYVVVLVRVY